MIRKTLMISAVLAFAIIASALPVHAQCTPLTLTANGSSSITVSPGSHVVFVGMLSNCEASTTSVSFTFSVISNGSTIVTAETETYVLTAGESRPISISFEAPVTAGAYVATATTSVGGSATATVNVS